MHEITMSLEPPLVPMDAAAFAELRNSSVPKSIRRKNPNLDDRVAATWMFRRYCERLLYTNVPLQQIAERYSGDVAHSGCWQRLSRGQRILYCLAALDCDVNNGGITQFFWNHPTLVSEVSETLQAVGETELAAAYDRALGSLLEKQTEWLSLRAHAESLSANLESFQASCDLLDLNWFDEAYCQHYGQTLLLRLLEYVDQHKDEFIEGGRFG